jgi:hypothetical protein
MMTRTSSPESSLNVSLPTALVRPGRLAVAIENLVVHQRHMGRVIVFWETRLLIYEFPDLDVARTWVCGNTLRVNALTIDGPKDASCIVSVIQALNSWYFQT